MEYNNSMAKFDCILFYIKTVKHLGKLQVTASEERFQHKLMHVILYIVVYHWIKN